MAVIGFHFRKMMVERKKAAKGKLNIKSNLSITNIKEAKINMGSTKQKGLEISFSYTTTYEPDVADITLEGVVVYLGSAEQVKEYLDTWEKEKKMHKSIIEEVYNYVLSRCNVQVLILSRDMQLPPHIQMPKVSLK